MNRDSNISSTSRLHQPTCRRRILVCLLLAVVSVPANSTPGFAARLDEMSLERWKKLREVERYQFQIAEKYFREKNWKVAAAEYEKYLTLYERSEAASHAQLKWSLCLVQQRKLNTAIKDGFQSVIDYWPDSADAIAASFYIGNSYKNMGEFKKAKRAYRGVLSKYPKHLVAVYTMRDLIDISVVEKDLEARVSLWKSLTFETARTKESKNDCIQASQQLAAHQFQTGSFNDGVKALATTYAEQQLPYYVLYFSNGPIRTLTADSKSEAKGGRLADQGIAYIRARIPSDRSTPEKKQAAQQLWFHIVDLHAAARRDAKVLETYRQIEKAFGIDDGLLGRLAGWYKSKGKYDEARKTYRRYKDKVAGQSQLANSYYQQSKFNEAVTTYRQVLALDPENPIKWKPSIAYNLRRAGKYKEAVLVYEELITDDSESPNRWRFEIGNTYRDFRQYKQAIGVYRQCENFPQNYIQMADCHRRLKQYNEAVVLYNQVIGGHKPSGPWALLQIGYTREQAGQKELAIKAMQQVCKRFPKDRYASQAHAHLQNKYKISVTLGGGKDE